jgi:hypothetical protein
MHQTTISIKPENKIIKMGHMRYIKDEHGELRHRHAKKDPLAYSNPHMFQKYEPSMFRKSFQTKPWVVPLIHSFENETINPLTTSKCSDLDERITSITSKSVTKKKDKYLLTHLLK